MNEMLAIAYDDVDEKKAERLRWCATVLGFIPSETGRKRLSMANFCRVRLCPMCMWRRSLKVQAQMHAILNAMAADGEKPGGKKYAYIYLTLTMKNCKPDKLKTALDKLGDSFRRLMQTKEIRDVVHGYYRAVEITHNVDPTSKDYDTYHPHIHAVLAVNPSYFNSRYYIKQERWTELWQRSLRVQYTPIVDVRKVKGNTAKAVAEAAGYGVKSSHYIIPDDWDLTVETVRLLDGVLAGRRFVGFGGVFREYQRLLKLDDAEDGDLVHINEDEPSEDDYRSKMIYYAWHTGYRQYRQTEI